MLTAFEVACWLDPPAALPGGFIFFADCPIIERCPSNRRHPLAISAHAAPVVTANVLKNMDFACFIVVGTFRASVTAGPEGTEKSTSSEVCSKAEPLFMSSTPFPGWHGRRLLLCAAEFFRAACWRGPRHRLSKPDKRMRFGYGRNHQQRRIG